MRRAFLILLVLAAAGAGLLYWRFDDAVALLFQYEPPKVDETKLADEAEGRQRDAAYFTSFTRYDRSYSPAARAQADALTAKLVQEAAGLTREQFVLRVAEITALADNGHTGVSSVAFAKRTTAVPLELGWFGSELRILRAHPEYAALLGARVDAIDGQPTEQIFQTLKKYVGGTEEHRRVRLVRFFRSATLLHAAGIARDDKGLTLKGVRADGAPFDARIEGVAIAGDAPYVPSTARLLFPSADDNVEWLSFLKRDAALPLHLQHSDKLFWSAPLENNGLYVDITHNTNGDEEKIGPFLQGVERQIQRQKPRFIVVDMRMNGGGDYTTTYDFGSRLPQMAPDARIYVLTSGFTFSAAITTTAFIKQAGGARVMIVGEPVGDRLTFWAEGGRFVLPNVELGVSYAAGKHDYAHWCLNVLECFWVNYLMPVRVDTLKPDIDAPLTFADYAAMRDPAFEAVMARERGTPTAAR